MARPLKAAPLPDYLEELMAILEAQDEPDRVGAIREVEGRREGLKIDLLAELDEHPEAAVRYGKLLQRVEMGLADAAVGRALKGKGSASNALKELRNLRGANGSPTGGNGRLMLERHHGARVAGFRRW